MSNDHNRRADPGLGNLDLENNWDPEFKKPHQPLTAEQKRELMGVFIPSNPLTANQQEVMGRTLRTYGSRALAIVALAVGLPVSTLAIQKGYKKQESQIVASTLKTAVVKIEKDITTVDLNIIHAQFSKNGFRFQGESDLIGHPDYQKVGRILDGEMRKQGKEPILPDGVIAGSDRITSNIRQYRDIAQR